MIVISNQELYRNNVSILWDFPYFKGLYSLVHCGSLQWNNVSEVYELKGSILLPPFYMWFICGFTFQFTSNIWNIWWV